LRKIANGWHSKTIFPIIAHDFPAGKVRGMFCRIGSIPYWPFVIRTSKSLDRLTPPK
jgi:hypothetical protein